MKVSCRFVPYDQWLITHVDIAWKVKDAKLWFVRKCVHDAASESSYKHPPPSPIIFADKHRPLSPMQFAGPSPSYDENDAQERVSSVRTDPQPSLKFTLPSTYNPEKLSLIRFSTGQCLEDDFTLEWYDIKPFELLEIHRTDIVFRLPRHNLNDYVQPYWEGRVRALRVISRPSIQGDPISKPPNFKTNRPSKDSHLAQLVWRDRWVVIQQGSLSVCKDWTDPIPSQVFHLSTLSALRDADHLRRSTSIVPTASQRIVCAKFLTKTKRTSSTADDQSNYDQTTIVTSDSAATSRSLSRPKIKLKIKPLPGLSKLSQPRRVYGLTTAEGSGTPSTTTVGRSEHLLRAISKERQKVSSTLGTENGVFDDPGTSSPEENQDAPFGSRPEPEPTESPVNSDTSALSSPVFAHDIDGTGSDDFGFSSEDEGQRIGYSHGYRYAASATVRSREKKQRDEYSKEVQDNLKIDTSTMQGFSATKEKQEHGEWIILDMIDESGFSSILRILHRHFPYPLSSTFTSLLPSLSAPTTLSNPTIEQIAAGPIHSQMSSPNSDESRFSYPQVDRAHSQYQHPVSLAVAHKLSSTFGALPYPEWRLTLSERARKAGIGQVGTVMETFLFGPAIPPQTPRRRQSKRRSSITAERRQSKMYSRTLVTPIDIEDTDSGEESSEVEWLGWLGDLPRQEQIAKERLHDYVFSKPANDPIAPESRTQHQPMFLETQVEDQRRFLEDRRALEPSAVVTSKFRDMTLRNSVPPSLSSPSSTESIEPVRFGFSPGDQYPPTVSAVHSRAQSESQFDFPGPSSTESLSFGRPSMLTMSDYGNAGLTSYSIASGTGSGSKSLSQPRSSILAASHAPSGRTMNFPIGPSSTSPSTFSSGSATVARRASVSGLVGPMTGGSVGRVHARTSALPKKKSGSLSESGHQEDSKVARELPPRRPRLSLSTSMSSQPSLSSSSTRPSSRTTSPTSVGRMIIRRVKSSSSLKSDEDDQPKNLKKRGLVRGVSSRLAEELTLTPRWAPSR